MRGRCGYAGLLLMAGWLFLAPPSKQLGDNRLPDTDAPLPRWDQISAHDSALECENHRRSVRLAAQENLDSLNITEEEKKKRLDSLNEQLARHPDIEAALREVFPQREGKMRTREELKQEKSVANQALASLRWSKCVPADAVYRAPK